MEPPHVPDQTDRYAGQKVQQRRIGGRDPGGATRALARECIEKHVDQHQFELLRTAEKSEREFLVLWGKTYGGRKMTYARRRLPNRRRSENFAYTCTFSRFPDTGEIAEVFLNNHKVNSHADVSARDAAVVCSIALQGNVPIDTIRRALIRNADGTASGPLGVALDLICGARRHE